jgi:hypothetical protein
MQTCISAGRLILPICLSLAFASGGARISIAEDRIERVARPANVVRPAPVCAIPARATLGTFEPTPYLMVRGNWPTGGGYSPLEVYGDMTLSLYGPISPLRSVSAPVRTYTRGYDGRLYVGEATSFSNPNLPGLSPVIYPTQGSYFYGPRLNRTPPWWSSATNWIDQQ